MTCYLNVGTLPPGRLPLIAPVAQPPPAGVEQQGKRLVAFGTAVVGIVVFDNVAVDTAAVESIEAVDTAVYGAAAVSIEVFDSEAIDTAVVGIEVVDTAVVYAVEPFGGRSQRDIGTVVRYMLVE